MSTHDAIKQYEDSRGFDFSVLMSIEFRQAEDERRTLHHCFTLVLRPDDSTDPRRLTLVFEGVRQLRFTQPETSEIVMGPLKIRSILERQWEGVAYAVTEPEFETFSLICRDVRITVAESAVVAGRRTGGLAASTFVRSASPIKKLGSP